MTHEPAKYESGQITEARVAFVQETDPSSTAADDNDNLRLLDRQINVENRNPN